MQGQLLILAAAFFCGFVLRLTLRGITRLSKKAGKPAVIALDFLAALSFAAAVLVLTLVLNDGVLVPFTTMFYFLGLSLPALFLKQ